MLVGFAPMEGVERMNVVIIHLNQKAEFAQCNLYTMDVDRRRNYYSCEGFGHLAWNCKRQIMGQGRKMEYEDNCNNGQSNLNREKDLIVLNYVSIIIGLQYFLE